jgi:hypothetical protein
MSQFVCENYSDVIQTSQHVLSVLNNSLSIPKVDMELLRNLIGLANEQMSANEQKNTQAPFEEQNGENLNNSTMSHVKNPIFNPQSYYYPPSSDYSLKEPTLSDFSLLPNLKEKQHVFTTNSSWVTPFSSNSLLESKKIDPNSTLVQPEEIVPEIKVHINKFQNEIEGLKKILVQLEQEHIQVLEENNQLKNKIKNLEERFKLYNL